MSSLLHAPGLGTAAVAMLAAIGCADPATYVDAGVEPGTEVDAGVEPDPPDTQLTATPTALSNAATARFELASVPAGLAFQCSLDGAVATACASPHDQPVDEGEHTLAVAALDAAGVVDPTPATFSWRVDLTAPAVTITAAPAPLDNSVTATFGFEADEDATFACSLDGAAAVACTSPHVVTDLVDGDHRLEVTARDLAGNTDPQPARHDWAIDTASPDTQIDDGPSGEVRSTSATLAFSSADAGADATFACSLDGAVAVACASPHLIADLLDGEHTFTVEVRDATGNVDPIPATRTWTVDTVAPTATITAGPAGPSNDPTPTFTFTTDGAPTSVQCRIGTAAPAACVSTYTSTPLADGTRTFRVTVTDAAGNTSTASRAFTIDTIAPGLSITSGPAEGSYTVAQQVQFAFSSSGAVETRCRLFVSDQPAPAYTTCTSPQQYPLPSQTAYTFEVRAQDAAGNRRTRARHFERVPIDPL